MMFSIHVVVFLEYGLHLINIGTEKGFSKRFLGFFLYVSNTTNMSEGKLCYHDTNYTMDTIPAVLNVTCPVHGRYIIYYSERLQGVTYPDGYSTYAFTDICEVEVYGTLLLNTIKELFRLKKNFGLLWFKKIMHRFSI
jgi:hypothetical protein